MPWNIENSTYTNDSNYRFVHEKMPRKMNLEWCSTFFLKLNLKHCPVLILCCICRFPWFTTALANHPKGSRGARNARVRRRTSGGIYQSRWGTDSVLLCVHTNALFQSSFFISVLSPSFRENKIVDAFFFLDFEPCSFTRNIFQVFFCETKSSRDRGNINIKCALCSGSFDSQLYGPVASTQSVHVATIT